MKKTILISLIAFLAVAAAGAGAVLFYNSIPPVAQQVVPVSRALQVNLLSPLSGASLPLNAPTRVDVHYFSQKPVQRLEFWVDNQAVGVKDLSGSTTDSAVPVSWTWTPPQAGNFTLLVRAYDSDGRFALSNAVRVHAGTEANGPVLLKHVLQQGDTLATLAQQNNVSPDAIVAVNPGYKAGDPLPEGATIKLPLTAPPAPPPDGSTPANTGQNPAATPGALQTDLLEKKTIPSNAPLIDVTGATVNKLTFFLTKGLSGLLNDKPKIFPFTVQPAFDASIQGCNVSLRMQPPTIPGVDVQTYMLYRLDPLSTSFSLIATLPGAGAGLVEGYLDPNLFGKFSYYVVAVMSPDQQQITSPIVDVEISDKACNKGQWSTLVVTQAQLTTSSTMGGGVYCYLTLNNTPWGHLPQTDGSTIPNVVGSANVYDLKPFFPTLILVPLPDPIDISMECWGINGGQAVSLGTTSNSFSTAGFPVGVDLTGSSFSASLIFDRGAPDPATVPAPSNLPPPIALRPIQSLQDCLNHLPADQSYLCRHTDMPNYEYLMWEWNPAACSGPSQATPTCAQNNIIDGYQVYMVGQNGNLSRYLFSNSPASNKVTETIRPQAGDEYCFIVRSVKGNVESVNSNMACVQSYGNGTDVLTGRTTNETYSNEVVSNCPVFVPNFQGITFKVGIIESPANPGFNYSVQPFSPINSFDPFKLISCDRATNQYTRGVIVFNLYPYFKEAPASPAQIHEAVLKYSRTSPGSPSCDAVLNVVTQANGNGSVAAFSPLGAISSAADQSVDVTSIIARQIPKVWSADTGLFMINTSHEDLNAHINAQCSESFGNFTLTISSTTN